MSLLPRRFSSTHTCEYFVFPQNLNSSLENRWETNWVRFCFPRRISWVLLVGILQLGPYQEKQRRRRSLDTEHVDDAPQNVDLIRRNESETEARGERKRNEGKKGLSREQKRGVNGMVACTAAQRLLVGVHVVAHTAGVVIHAKHGQST